MTRPRLACVLPLIALAVGCSDAADEPTPPAAPAATPAAAPPRTEAPAATGQGASGDVKVDMSTVAMLFKADPPEKGKNRVTPAKVALGRQLYEDKRLSRNGDVSCASCHALDAFGQDGKKTSPGAAGAAGKRHTPTSFNASRQFAQFWDYRAETVEDLVAAHLVSPTEHGLADDAGITAILKGIPEYAEPFKKAFAKDEDPITAENVRQAVGAFVRTLKTRSRFDEFVEGKADALTNEEKRGLNAFIKATCTVCHMTRLVGGSLSQKLGLVRPVETEDKGRHQVTKAEGDKYLFKVPSLLNVEKTAPYLHDGSIESLEETVRYMVKHQAAVPVGEEDIKAIIAFLKALTGKLEG